MAGKSFKGNLEVLNLSDIFQSLAMNRHSGTLIVTDGKREKKIFFAEGEITLLSSSRRQRLGDLLIAERKITSEDLELALKLQKQSRKKLGEILIEEGFCEGEDIDRLVRQQIEEEIYDLFLWRKAEFEFIADQMPDDMAQESPNLTRLAFNTNSLIMEALRRLDEWTLIRDLVPSTKEVFYLTNQKDVDAAPIPERIKADALKFIDGKTTVEQLAEKFFVSEFELCKYLAEMAQAGVVRALTVEELADRAEECYALNDFAGSAALYGRLAEHFPDQPKILTPLADSLRRTGAEKQSLSIYEQLAEHLESSQRDPDRLRQVYEAITQLDPSRQDLARRLEDLHLKAVNKPAKRWVAPLVGGLVLVALVGVGLALRGRIVGNGLTESLLAKKAHDLSEEINDARVRKDYERWFKLGWQLLDECPQAPEANKVELPVLVRTEPPGFLVYVNGVAQEEATRRGDEFLVCKIRPSTHIKVQIKTRPPREGGDPREVALRFFEDPKAWPGVITFQIVDKESGSFGGDLWFEAGVAWSQQLQAYLAPCRDGNLRVLRDREGRLDPVTGWDRLALGKSQLGDLFTRPVVTKLADGSERLLVGAVEGGVISLDLREGDPPKDGCRSDLYPATGAVVGAPLVIGADVIEGGRVIFATSNGEVLAYPLAGAKRPVWRARAEAPLEGGGAVLIQRKVIAFRGLDHHVYAFDAVQGKPAWDHPYESRVPLAGDLHALGSTLILQEQGACLTLLDGATGQRGEVEWRLPEAEAFGSVLIDPAKRRLFVADDRGRVVALSSDLSPLWKAPVAPPNPGPVRLGLNGDWLVLAFGYPSGADSRGPAVQVRDVDQGGALLWQAAFQGGVGTVTTPVSVFPRDAQQWEVVFGVNAGNLLFRFVVEGLSE